MLSRVRFGDGVVGVVADGAKSSRTGPEIDDLVSFLASLTSPQYRELGANELARQREIARTTRPQPRHGASLWAETAPARATRPALGRSAHTASACRTGRAGMTTARSSRRARSSMIACWIRRDGGRMVSAAPTRHGQTLARRQRAKGCAGVEAFEPWPIGTKGQRRSLRVSPFLLFVKVHDSPQLHSRFKKAYCDPG